MISSILTFVLYINYLIGCSLVSFRDFSTLLIAVITIINIYWVRKILFDSFICSCFHRYFAKKRRENIWVHWTYFTSVHHNTGCSLNIVFFSKNFKYFVISPWSALGCYWLYRKWPANKGGCTLRWVDLLHAGKGLQ